MNDFETELRDRLRAHERDLEPDLQERLGESRKVALGKIHRFRIPRFLLPLAGMTLASVAALILVFSPTSLQNNGNQGTLSPDTVQTQDLDFYYWLAETQDVAGS